MQIFRARAIVVIAALTGLASAGLLASPASAIATQGNGYGSPGGGLPTSVAVSPDSRFAYISDDNSKRIYRFDLKTRTYGISSAPMPNGEDVQRLQVSPDGKRLYATTTQNSGACGFVYLNAQNLSYLGCTDVTFDEGGSTNMATPKQFVVNSTNTRAYIIGADSAGVHEIDLTANNKSTAQINFKPLSDSSLAGMNERLTGIAITPDGSTLFIPERDWWTFDASHDHVFVLSTATLGSPAAPDELSAPFSQPTGVAVSPDGSKVFVSDMTVTGTPDHGDNRVFVFNTRTRALIGQFDATSSFGNTANGLLSVSPDSSQVVVVNYGETSSLRFVSTVSLTTVQELALEIYDMAGLGLLEAVFTPDGTSVVFPSQLVAGIFIVDVDPPLAVSDQALPDTGADFGSLGLFGVAVALLGVALLAYKRRVR